LTNKALGCLSSLRSYTVDLTVPLTPIAGMGHGQTSSPGASR
jgi:hypothetical protein